MCVCVRTCLYLCVNIRVRVCVCVCYKETKLRFKRLNSELRTNKTVKMFLITSFMEENGREYTEGCRLFVYFLELGNGSFVFSLNKN